MSYISPNKPSHSPMRISSRIVDKNFTNQSAFMNQGSFINTPKNQTQTPQTISNIENIPIQKYYTDYEPIIEHEQIPYDRTYQEFHNTALGNQVPVKKVMTDYQTIQHTTYKAIQVPYTDYQQVEHRTEYIPHIRYDTSIDHIALQVNQVQQVSVPVQQQYVNQNGQVVSQLQNVNQYQKTPKNDYIAQQKVHQYVDHEAVNTTRVILESTVKMPVVDQPQPSSIVVQNSIHEVNTPQINNQFQNQMNYQPQFNNNNNNSRITPIQSTNNLQNQKHNRSYSNIN